MLNRTKRRLGLKPKRLAADTAYGTGKFLGWLAGQKITPHIPVWDKSQREDGTFARDEFAYDTERDVSVCPNGKILKSTGTLHAGNTFRYISRKPGCGRCPLKPQCCPKQPQRRILRDPNEAARDHARKLAGTAGFKCSSNERKKAEMRFAHLKTHHRFERMRLRGLSGACDGFHLAAIAQNLKLLASRIMIPAMRLATA
jgi:hypothetical protein